MPSYEFMCTGCGETTTKLMSMATYAVSKEKHSCPCGEPLKPIVSTSAFSLKGNGWARDNYRTSRTEVK
jgi:putative FmdB family regulatory protein